MHIVKGSTYRDTLRWATSECVFVAATLVPGAPVRFHAPAHGLVDGWSVGVDGHDGFSARKRFPVRVVDADAVEIPCMNGSALAAGAVVLRYNAPTDMAGYSARQQIRNKPERFPGDPDSIVLIELLSTSPEGQPRIIIDNVAKTVVREIPASVTETLAWKKGIYDLEMVQSAYVIKIDAGEVTVGDEVTT